MKTKKPRSKNYPWLIKPIVVMSILFLCTIASAFADGGGVIVGNADVYNDPHGYSFRYNKNLHLNKLGQQVYVSTGASTSIESLPSGNSIVTFKIDDLNGLSIQEKKRAWYPHWKFQESEHNGYARHTSIRITKSGVARIDVIPFKDKVIRVETTASELDNGINLILPIVDTLEIDEELPVMHSIQIDKKEVGAEEFLTFTIEAEDAISGLQGISMGYELNNDATLTTVFKRDKGSVYTSQLKWRAEHGLQDGKIQIRAQLDKYTESGTVKITSINLIDYAGNTASYHISNEDPQHPTYFRTNFTRANFDRSTTEKTALSVLKFTVRNNKNIEKQDPVIKNFRLLKNRYDVMDNLQFVLEANDSQSGIAEYSINARIARTNKQEAAGNLYYSKGDISEEEKYNTKFHPEYKLDGESFNLYQRAGRYYIESIFVSDRAGNNKLLVAYDAKKDEYPWTRLKPDFEYYVEYGSNKKTTIPVQWFTLTENIYEDTEEPVLHAVSIDKAEYRPGEVINIKIETSDNLAGLKEASAFYLVTEQENFTSNTKSASNNSPDNRRMQVLNVYKRLNPWGRAFNAYIDSIYIADNAGNGEAYHAQEGDEFYSKTEANDKKIKTDIPVIRFKVIRD